VQDLGDVATEVYNLQVYQERDSRFTTHTVTLSGALIRNNLSFLPYAENCETHLFGLFMGRGRMHVDNHTLVDHARPNCFSNELYKGILEDESTGVFNGKVYVRQDAQKTNAYQSNKSIVLSDRANMYSKPELEIYADDVKCSHGATTGQIDPEALFYLRARGLSERLATALLLQAFAKDVVDNIRIAPLREMLDAYIVDRFHD
jgi:Fe-S cluster assembly protein SufD